MVTADEREWGLIESPRVGRIQEEGASPRSVDNMGFSNWEDSALVRFSKFLGFSTTDYEDEIWDLLRKIHSDQLKDKGKGQQNTPKCESELKKLKCTINYNGRSSGKGSGRNRGNLFLKFK